MRLLQGEFSFVQHESSCRFFSAWTSRWPMNCLPASAPPACSSPCLFDSKPSSSNLSTAFRRAHSTRAFGPLDPGSTCPLQFSHPSPQTDNSANLSALRVSALSFLSAASLREPFRHQMSLVAGIPNSAIEPDRRVVSVRNLEMNRVDA